MAEERGDPLIVVRATETGFANGARVRAGKTFSIRESQFSPRWMEKTTPGTSDELAAAKEASPKQRGSAGVTLKGKKEPPPGGRRGLEPEAGI